MGLCRTAVCYGKITSASVSGEYQSNKKFTSCELTLWKDAAIGTTVIGRMKGGGDEERARAGDVAQLWGGPEVL